MLTLYEKRIQMTGVLNLAVVVNRLPRIKYQTIHPKPTEKTEARYLSDVTLYIHGTIKMVSEMHN